MNILEVNKILNTYIHRLHVESLNIKKMITWIAGKRIQNGAYLVHEEKKYLVPDTPVCVQCITYSYGAWWENEDGLYNNTVSFRL